MPFGIVATESEVSDNGLSVTVHETDTDSRWTSYLGIILATKSAYWHLSCLLPFRALWGLAQGRVKRDYLLPTWKDTVTNLIDKWHANQNGYRQLLAIPNLKRRRLPPICTCSRIVTTASTIWLVSLFCRGLSHRCIDEQVWFDKVFPLQTRCRHQCRRRRW